MSIMVLGAGAIGLLLAGRLANTEPDVTLIARPNTAAQLSETGIVITEHHHHKRVERLTIRSATSEPQPGEQPPDLLIVCVKGYDTAAAMATIAAFSPKQIMTIQNGLGNEELLSSAFGPQHVISAVITTSVSVVAPGHVQITKTGGIGLAPLDNQQAVDQWAAVFRRAGFSVRTYPDYRAMKWSKVLLNILGNATAAILDAPVGEVYRDSRMIDLDRQAFLEALRVMDRHGIRPVNLPRYPARLLALLMRSMPPMLLDPALRLLIGGGRGGKRPSLHQDLARNQQHSEAAMLYGAIAQASREIGIEAPVNQVLSDVIFQIATGRVDWSYFRRRPDRLLERVERYRHEISSIPASPSK